MKKLKFILLALMVAATMSTCQKDYPKDIPDWLKQRIKEMKKDRPSPDSPRVISEYAFNANTIYCFLTEYGTALYCYNGALLCLIESEGSFIPNENETVHIKDFDIFIDNYTKYFVRIIWREKY